MNNINDQTEFIRQKIYEKLDYQPEPEIYQSRVPWIIQQQIAATNGIHYADRIGRLSDFPKYNLPVQPVESNDLPVMLDIGCGWGRWLVAGAEKGYLPVGVDIRLEFCQTSRAVLREMNKPGYAFVADLDNLPFKDDIFNLIWSFSVIQHNHKTKLLSCLSHIERILSQKGFAMLEFPNKNGIRNALGPARKFAKSGENPLNWNVRYYTIPEYKAIFGHFFDNFSFKNHSFLGIGVLPEDLKYVSFKNKIACSLSLLGTQLTKIIPGLKYFSDSIYIVVNANKSVNIDIKPNPSLIRFRQNHLSDPGNNLNLLPLLKCPKYGGNLELSADNKRAISEEAGIYYPVENDIPILVSSEARPA